MQVPDYIGKLVMLKNPKTRFPFRIGMVVDHKGWGEESPWVIEWYEPSRCTLEGYTSEDIQFFMATCEETKKEWKDQK